MNDVKIFVDLDGVVVDLYGGLNELFNVKFKESGKVLGHEMFPSVHYGNYHLKLEGVLNPLRKPVNFKNKKTIEEYFFFEKIHKTNLFEYVHSEVDPYEFWFNLKKNCVDKKGYLFWDILIDDFGIDNIYILSAATKVNTGACKKAKFDWVSKNLPFIKAGNVIILDSFHEKYKYAEDNFKNVLIDDFSFLVEDWRKNGGTAILFDQNKLKKSLKQIKELKSRIELFDKIKNIKIFKEEV